MEVAVQVMNSCNDGLVMIDVFWKSNDKINLKSEL